MGDHVMLFQAEAWQELPGLGPGLWFAVSKECATRTEAIGEAFGYAERCFEGARAQDAFMARVRIREIERDG